MPASQTGFGGFFLERSGGMTPGYPLPVLGCPPPPPPGVQPPGVQQQQQHLVPISYSGLQGYNFLPYAQHRHVAHLSGSAAPQYHPALLARAAAAAAAAAPFYAPYRPGAAEDPARVAKVATRESTGALKAWLQEHLKNPYPTKGEKIMLAIVTRMSLTQVSTWFANARRRLKKENRVSWASRAKSDNEEEEEEEEEDEADSDEDDKCPLDPGARRAAGREDPGAPADAAAAALGRVSAAETPERGGPAAAAAAAADPPPLRGKDSAGAQKPKIWSLAETATSESARRPADRAYPPAAAAAALSGRLWAEWWASRHGHGLLVPAACFPAAAHEMV